MFNPLEGYTEAQINTRINEINKYFNRESIYRQLEVSKKFLLPNKPKLQFSISIGGCSFYDGKKVVIGLPTYMIFNSFEEIFSSLKAILGHECEHGASSDLIVLKKYIKEVANDLYIRRGLNKSLGEKIAHYIANSIEDGRIEKILVNRLRGYIKHIKYFRGMWWKNHPCQGENELSEFLFAICTVATTGLYPKNWEKYYQNSRAEENVKKVRPLIIKGINAQTQQGCCNICKEIIYEIEDYLMELLQDENMMANLMINQDYNTSESNQSSAPSSNSTSVHFKPEQQEGEQNQGQENSQSQSSKNNGKRDGSQNYKSYKENNQGYTKEDGEKKENKKGSSSYAQREDNYSSYINDSEIVDQEINKIRDEALEEAQRALDKAKREDDLKAKQKAKEEAEEKRSTISEEELNKIAKEYPLKNKPEFTQRKFKAITNNPLPTEIMKEGKKLRKEIEKIFLDKKTFNLRHQKRGMLDTNALWQIGVKDYNIFQKKGNPNRTDYVFYILKDGSGSMGETVNDIATKWFYACKATAVLEEAVKNMIPLKITTFTSGYKHNMHYIEKEFNENSKTNKAWDFYYHYEPYNRNMDGHSIRVATAELMKRPEMKKVLIVLSDGLPSGYSSEDFAYADVRNAVREARKHGIKVISIAFGSESHRKSSVGIYKSMYQQSIISCEPDKITNELIRVFKQEIIK